MKKLLLGFLLLLSHLAISQEIRFNNISGFGEFDNGSIMAIAEDDLGRMWFGSREGLHMYDANQVQSFYSEVGNESSINSNWIQCLGMDEFKTLWVATDNGICSISTIDFSIKRYNIAESGSRENTIVSLFIDEQTGVWIGAYGGIYHFDSADQKFKKIELKGVVVDFVVNNFIRNRNGDILLVTDNKGIFYFEPKTNTVVPFGSDSLNKFEIRNAVQDKKGTYWLATKNNGIVKLDKTNKLEIFKPNKTHSNILSLIIDDNTIYALTDGDGLYAINQNTQKLSKFKIGDGSGLKSNVVFSAYKDSRNTMWIGLINSGVCFLNEYSTVFKHYLNRNSITNKAGVSILDVLSLSEDEVLLATDGDGIIKLNTRTGSFNRLNLKGIRIVKCLYQDKSGLIWGGTYQHGLICLNKNLELKEHYPTIENKTASNGDDSVWAIYEDSKGAFWVGTLGGGLFKFDRKLKQFYSCKDELDDCKIKQSVITVLFSDSKDRFWVGTKEGLLYRDKLSKKFVSFEEGGYQLSNSTIRQVFEDRNKNIWIGTEDGLNCLQGDSLKVFTKRNGLSGNRIQYIVQDYEGRLWIATTFGLNLLTEDYRFRVFLEEDGLSANNFNTGAGTILPNGNILIAGVNGITRFTPRDIQRNLNKADVILTNLWVNGELLKSDHQLTKNKHISRVKELQLKYDQRFFSLEFAALNYYLPQKNEYAYKLDGFNEEWINAGHDKKATYTNLSPGDYIFKVKASNNDGIWNEKYLELKIVILPPWWDTWWANLIFVSILLGVVFFFRSYVVRGERFKIELESKELENRQKEELEKMKAQFFTNISHELRTPLSLIVAPMSSLIKKDDQLNSKERTAIYSTIKKNCDRLLSLVDQLLYFRKLESGKLKPKASEILIESFVNEIVYKFQHTKEKDDINFNVRLHCKESKVWADIMMLENIFYNLISNAIKYAGKSKVEIEIGCKEENSGILIWVKDNGVGISKSDQKKIFDRFYQVKNQGVGTGIGLSFVKEIIELHKADIWVESELDKGASFIMRFKKDNSHFSKNDLITPLDSNSKRLTPNNSEDKLVVENVESGVKLLIVEDSLELCEYLESEFNAEYKIKIANNGKEGIKLTESFFPDIIISDVMMPEMNGVEFCRKVKSKLATSHIPVVLLTAKSTDDELYEGLESGADAYVTKPFNIDVLKLRIKKLIETRNQLKKRFTNALSNDNYKVEISGSDKRLLKKLDDYIAKNILNTELSIEGISEEIGISRSHFHKKMKALTGCSPSEYVRNYRLKKSLDLLKQNKYSIEEVSFSVGFSSPSYFSRSFTKFYGKSPKKYLEQ